MCFTFELKLMGCLSLRMTDQRFKKKLVCVTFALRCICCFSAVLFKGGISEFDADPAEMKKWSKNQHFGVNRASVAVNSGVELSQKGLRGVKVGIFGCLRPGL
jgi:hypothetical protein